MQIFINIWNLIVSNKIVNGCKILILTCLGVVCQRLEWTFIQL